MRGDDDRNAVPERRPGRVTGERGADPVPVPGLGPGQRGGGWRAGRLAAALGCLALLAAGCSGSPAHTGAPSGGDTTSALAYSQCMRSHGITKFPDPNAQGGIAISSGDGVNPSSAQFQAANKACQSKMPGGHVSPAQQAKIQARLLRFAQCMRTHGVPGYPDPTFGTGGRVSQKISKGSGVDPNSPQFRAAEKACGQFQKIGTGPGGGQSLNSSG
jgi:hypothetical protein